jgi:hypothetical protein
MVTSLTGRTDQDAATGGRSARSPSRPFRIDAPILPTPWAAASSAVDDTPATAKRLFSSMARTSAAWPRSAWSAYACAKRTIARRLATLPGRGAYVLI